MQLRELCPGEGAQQVRALAWNRMVGCETGRHLLHCFFSSYPCYVCRIKKGKCQFQYCDRNYKYNFFGRKHYNSYVYSGPVLRATTTPVAAIITSTSTPSIGMLTAAIESLCVYNSCVVCALDTIVTQVRVLRCFCCLMPIAYDADGWRQVGAAKTDHDLHCRRLNAGYVSM